MQRAVFNLTVFLMGGMGYSIIEVLWRGYTHWSMALTGGVCLMLICYIQRTLPNVNTVFKSVFGGFLITGVEFLVGLVVNVWLGLEVWNYSAEPFNYMGQVCILYTALWCLLCIPVFWACKSFLKVETVIKEKLFSQNFKKGY